MDPSGALCQVSVLGWGGWRGRERSGSSVLALRMDGGPAPHLGLLGGGGQLQLIKHLFEFKFVRQFSLGRIWEWAVLPSWGSGWSCCALLTPSVPV